MPNGRSRPAANTWFSDGMSAPSAARITRMRFTRVSAMKISPLGATRSRRGPDKPVASCRTVKPGGTDNTAFAGRLITRGPLPDDVVR